jgi:hypothetical protein
MGRLYIYIYIYIILRPFFFFFLKKKKKYVGVAQPGPLGYMGVAGHPHFGQGDG